MATASKTDAPWTGPSAGEMVRNRTLAKEIMARHNDPCPVLDERELANLRKFVNDPSSANIKTMCEEHGWRPAENDFGGSLVGFTIVRHGTESAAFTDEDIVNLKGWFDDGKAGEIPE